MGIGIESDRQGKSQKHLLLHVVLPNTEKSHGGAHIAGRTADLA
jgi:hypothetical protein